MNENLPIDPGFSVYDMYTVNGTEVPEGLPGTPFFQIYCTFLDNVTDDMYMELTYEDTFKLLEKMLMQAISMFKWPRFPKYAYNKNIVTMVGEKEVKDEQGNSFIEEVVLSKGCWTIQLTLEEVDILSDLMMLKWVDSQLFSANNTKMRYSSSDFKFTSQANHINKLSALRKELEKSINSKQSLYRRHKIDKFGNVTPDYDGLASQPKYSEWGEDWWYMNKLNITRRLKEEQLRDI